MIDAPPPARDALVIPVRVERIPNGESWPVTVTSHRAARVWTHYLDKRTRPCRAPECPCPACEVGRHRQWEAYISAYVEEKRTSMVLVIPALCWLDLQPKIKELPDILGAGGRPQKDLRGLRLTLRRPGKDIRGRLYADVAEMPRPDRKVPPGLDVLHILSRMWQMDIGRLPQA